MTCYYLHENGTLHYKPSALASELTESPFVRCYWPVYGFRQELWQVIIESLAMGVSRAHIMEVLEDNHFDVDDCITYITFLGAKLSSDGNEFCVTRGDFINLEESPAGFGDTPMDALANLLTDLGFKNRHVGGHDINSLVKCEKPTGQVNV